LAPRASHLQIEPGTVGVHSRFERSQYLQRGELADYLCHFATHDPFVRWGDTTHDFTHDIVADYHEPEGSIKGNSDWR